MATSMWGRSLCRPWVRGFVDDGNGVWRWRRRRLDRRHRNVRGTQWSGAGQCGADEHQANGQGAHEALCRQHRHVPTVTLHIGDAAAIRGLSPKVHRDVGKPLLGGKPPGVRNGQRPLRRSAKRASGEVSLYSGIHTPKKLKPHWLKPWFQIGFSL
jgi:hypothetical protein